MAVSRTGAAWAAGVCLALLLGGCGGMSADKQYKMQLAQSIAAQYSADLSRATSAPSAPVGAAFLARVDAICAPVLAYNDAHPNPYPSFDYNHPDVPTLKLEGVYFSASPFNDALQQLTALGAPQQNASTWETLVRTAAALREQSLRQNAAATAGDTTAFSATLGPVVQLARTLSVDAHQAGFGASSACMRLFSGS
jgi:hypothetical protein